VGVTARAGVRMLDTSLSRRLAAALEAAMDASTAVDDGVSCLQQAFAKVEDNAAPPAVSEHDRPTLELVMRLHLDGLLKRSKATEQSIESVGVPRLLDVAIALVLAELAEPNTPFLLLEDLFDANVVSAAEAAFALIEARAAALAEFVSRDTSSNNKSKLTILRTCNELLRRLSKSKNTNFRGRVLMFMAYTFPLSERSGVNLKGTVATSSVEAEPEDALEDAKMAIDGANGCDGRGAVIDYSFYATFWGLQQSFTNPAACVTAEAWKALVERLEAVLQVFGSFSGAADASSEPSEAAGAGAPAAHPTEGATAIDTAIDTAMDAAAALGAVADHLEGSEAAEVYFAKFLTSAKLMTLQLRDGYFRRHVLVQVLIFLQAVQTGGKHAAALTAAQSQTADSLQGRCVQLLEGIPPAGARFAAAVLTMLEREEHWIKWKAAGCAAFDKAATLVREEGGARKRRSVGGGGAGKRMQLGNASLTRLWNMGGNSLEAIAQKQHDAIPSLEAYLQPVHEQMDPEAGIEEEYKVKNDKAYQWKALRLMAKKDVSLLSKVSAPNGSIEVAVKSLFNQAAPAEPEDSVVDKVDEKV